MASTVTLDKQETSFVLYPKEIEEFFLNNDVTIPLYPNDLFSEQETEALDLKITSASQYNKFLDSEINFWKENDSNQKLDNFVHISRFHEARNHFNTALRYLHSKSSMESYLRQSIKSLSQNVLSSQTKLASELIKYVDKSSSFIEGFRMGLLVKSNTSFSTTSDTLQGFYAAMVYRKVFDTFSESTQESLIKFQNNAEEATKHYSTLNENYTKSYLEQERRLKSIEEQTNAHFSNLTEKENVFFNSANEKLEVLEKQYQENLKLKAPAQYWSEMEEKYIKKGRFWLLISGAISLITVGLLVCILVFAPNVFSKENHWLENVKNSAIVTVTTSICIYILRTTMKMAMSSFHLSRDAKERNTLSVFYLSLIEDDAVTDKERAIVLNALFSRSDTGLLKGDSSPTMTSNVSDLVEVLKKIK